jgi:hypothetical protein
LNTPHRTAALLVLLLSFALPLASADAKVNENATRLKHDVLSTFATWVPFLVLFCLIACALAAIGIHLWGPMK